MSESTLSSQLGTMNSATEREGVLPLPFHRYLFPDSTSGRSKDLNKTKTFICSPILTAEAEFLDVIRTKVFLVAIH